MLSFVRRQHGKDGTLCGLRRGKRQVLRRNNGRTLHKTPFMFLHCALINNYFANTIHFISAKLHAAD
jgi:hypothetical protein